MIDANAVTRIRRQVSEIERLGALTPDVLAFVYEERLFKLFVPEELGGRRLDLPEALRVFEHASWIDGSFGWLVTIGSGGGFFANYIAEEMVEQVFGPKASVIAGSGRPCGIATRTASGYRVSGRWPYCSGAVHATVFTANAWILDGAEKQAIRSFILFPHEVTVHRDWEGMGLRGTCSHSISVEGVVVPECRTFDLARPTGRYDDPLYRYPFLSFAQASFAAVVLGIARHFIDEAEAVLERRQAQQADAPDAPARDRAARAGAAVAAAKRTWAQSRDDFYRAVERSWTSCVERGAPAPEEQEAVGRQSRLACDAVTKCVDAIVPYLGMEGIIVTSDINRIWRDLHTARQHAVLV